MPLDVVPPEVLRQAIEACPSGMVGVNGAGVIVLANGEIERLFGYTRAELVGSPVEILLPEALRYKHTGQRNAFMHQPSARRLGTGRDFLGRRKDGREFPIEVGLNPQRIGDDIIVLCAVVDISERKRLERLQDEFVTTVSHELRTPMTSIAGSLGLLIGGACGTLPKSAAHLLAIAHSNCQRLVRLVNDILDIKKLEAGQTGFVLQLCSTRDLVEQAIEANRGFADSHHVRVELRAAKPFDVRVDPDRFIQVIVNLLSNACKFSTPGGKVVVAVERRETNVQISVRDHGAGIPPAFKPRVFERFAQGDSADGQSKSGSGLGLSIVRQIVTQMDGQVGFKDAPGGGTIFYVDLPSADRPAQEVDRNRRGPEVVPAKAKRRTAR